MPPLPKSSPRSEEGTRTSYEQVKREYESTGARPRGRSERSSSAAQPKTPPRGRATKIDTLENKIALFYRMLGTAIRPFGRFYPAFTGIGDNLKTLSDDAAEAWIELGQQDKRVLDAWVAITSASTWGNVVGIHLAIFASAIPGGEYFQAMNQPTEDNPADNMDQVIATAKAMGLSDEEIQAMMKQAEDFVNKGGPGDTIRTGGTPEPPVDDASFGRAGIVTPDELGVTQKGQDGTFPTDHAPPNGR